MGFGRLAITPVIDLIMVSIIMPSSYIAYGAAMPIIITAPIIFLTLGKPCDIAEFGVSK